MRTSTQSPIAQPTQPVQTITEQNPAQIQPIVPPQIPPIAQLGGVLATINLFLIWLIAKEVNKAIAKLTAADEK